MASSDEVYPKAPLAEVIFEIQFPGEPAVECHRDELFESVRTTLPVVLVPEVAAERHFKFRTYQFASKDGAFTVMAGINQLGYSSKRYTGFADFRNQLLPVFRYFCERFKIDSLRRIGFRYINAIPYIREEGAIPLGRFFRSTFTLSPDISAPPRHCSIGLVQPCGSGEILTRIETMMVEKSKEEALLLDFDYFETRNLKAANLEKHLDASHQHAKSYFESIITEEYRGFIRGKPLL